MTRLMKENLLREMPKPISLSVIVLFIGCGGGGGGGSSSGGDVVDNTWLIPQGQVVDGGPGKDGIPALINPVYVALDQATVSDGSLVIGIKLAADTFAYPHDIMDWHEVLNDTLPSGPIVLSYCPLTGSAMLWKSTASDPRPTFGVSGLLYNSNLILYDRQTDSDWSQMRVQAVRGLRRGEVPESLPLVEMTIESWREMYPGSAVLSRQTGHDRDYDSYPYGGFRLNDELLFPVTPYDQRLHEKTRVVGVAVGGVARAYVIDEFASFIEIINDEINNIPIVVIGSSDSKYGVIFERTLSDGTVLTFAESADPRPTVMTDNEGNTWDIFGEALTGSRATQRLGLPKSHVAYWFAWGAFHPDSEIYNRN